MNAITLTRDENSLSREELREIVRLLDRCRIAKCGDEWGPSTTNRWLTGGRSKNCSTSWTVQADRRLAHD